MNTKKPFLWVLGISTCIRILFAKIVPITGDEAYFIVWAKHLSWGYYEHPPMIGWVMWLFSFLGNDIFIYRIFPLIAIPLMTVIIVNLLKEVDRNRAFLCASIFLLSPVSILNVLSVNDVPLILFTFLSGVFFYRALKTLRIFDAVLSGFFFGCAFLSKYFSVLFGMALLIFCMVTGKKNVWKTFFLFFIGSLPLITVNILWNYTHCWLNIMFNLFYRNKGMTLNFFNVFIYLLEQIFLMTPYLSVKFYKNRCFLDECKKKNLFCFVFLTPFFFFLFISLIKSVGLHWMASFYPFFFLVIAHLPFDALDRALRHCFYLSLTVMIIVVIIFAIPVEVYKGLRKYPQIVMFLRPSELCEIIEKNLNGRIPASTGYTETSVLSYHCRKDFVLFGSLSRSGRYYDYITDFRNFDGKDFLIVSLNEKDVEKFAMYFQSLSVKNVEVMGAKFYLVNGNHFIFNNYRNLYLRKISSMYYSPVRFLPASRNFFMERYFSG
ncbi:MAG TPA: glycosyltransferase family 39 protein [bacterium]|nr:glycosyltransferase family 39 protein [bacterium]HOL34957.1 glycosyltransferase family 39 protein [bacterium]HPP08508.1 glycosyltransferase family 39 protein [bacterium]